MNCNLKLPNIWGQGALFAYCGLEGECDYYKNLCGTLMADCLGIQFRNLKRSQDKAFLIMSPQNVFNIKYHCVSSDMIIADIIDKDQSVYPLEIVFINQNTIVMRSRNDCGAKLVFDYDVLSIEGNEATVYDGNGNLFAIAKRVIGDTVTVAVSCYDNVVDKSLTALNCELDEIINRRIKFYEELPRPPYFTDDAEERLYYKCYSVLRATIYTPQGKLGYHSLTPNRFPHRAIWLWDTAYLVAGMKYISYDIAKDAILAILQCRHENGFLPHMTTPNWQSSITQPPVLSWATLELYHYGKDKEFLAKCYDALSAYVTWDFENRDTNQNGLPEWVVGDDPLCRCDESGLDNTPRFDEAEVMDCIDFAAFLANDMRCLSKIADILGKSEDAEKWNDRYQNMKDKTNEILWDEDDKFYYDRRLCDNKFHKIKTPASFITLFARICDNDKAAGLVEHFNNANEFATAFPLPSVSADYETYSTKDMFHGPVWMNFNYLVSRGLDEYGYTEEAEVLRQKTINTIKRWYLNDGVLYEFYDSMDEISPSRLSRKGIPLYPYAPEIKYQSVRDFSWGACAIIDFMMQRK